MCFSWSNQAKDHQLAALEQLARRFASFWPHEMTGAVEAAWCAVTVAKVVTKVVSTQNDLRIRETC
jgi:hypothetical protein